MTTTHPDTSKGEANEARAILQTIRSMFDVEYHDDGRIASVGHASDGLRKMVSILDTALSTPSAGGLGTVKALTWSDTMPPTEGVCSYDHCRAKMPFGTYSIEWKSWKDYDDCVVYCPENADGDVFVTCDGTLDGAKAAAQADFNARILSALDRTSLPPTEGMVLVPKTPTPEMLGAWYRYKNGHHWHDEPPPRDTSDYGAYAAMLAASPQVRP